MEKIVIEVPDASVKKWRMSCQQLCNKISREINIRLAKELMSDSKEEFRQSLNEVADTMKK